MTPVVAVVLMVAIAIFVASALAIGVATVTDDLGEAATQYEEVVTPSGERAGTAAGNPWSGSVGDLLRLSNTEAGATDVTYRVNFTVQPGSDTVGNSLNSVYIEVRNESPDMFSDTLLSDLIVVGVDTDGDGSIDTEISHDVDSWTPQNDGSALKIGFGGSAYTPSANDSIVVEFSGVDNPDTAGTYDVRAQTSGDGNWDYGSITITPS